MRQIGSGHAFAARISSGAAIAAMTALAACATPARPAALYADLGDPNPSGCVGDGTLHVNNTYGQPVDIYADANGLDKFLGTAQPGRSEYPMNDAGVQFVVRPVGKRTILEATGARHPATDRVQFMVSCKSE